ncbi:MAG: YSC84-related protein [Flavisolibacter sp.]
MKKFNVLTMAMFSLLLTAVIPTVLKAQDTEDKDKLLSDSRHARDEFIKTDSLMKSLFDNSVGYVIFPNVGKGAVGIGGAAGNGILFEHGNAVGKAKMKQVTVGFQFGGQAYREVIFFENDAALQQFKTGNFALSAQASAVAVTKGAATNIKYRNGVMIFTQEKGGLMYEAAVGGQKFGYSAF